MQMHFSASLCTLCDFHSDELLPHLHSAGPVSLLSVDFLTVLTDFSSFRGQLGRIHPSRVPMHDSLVVCHPGDAGVSKPAESLRRRSVPEERCAHQGGSELDRAVPDPEMKRFQNTIVLSAI